jgi:MFS family permease
MKGLGSNFDSLYLWIRNNYEQIPYAYILLFANAIFFRPYTAPGQLLIIDSYLYMEIAAYVLDDSFWTKFFNGDAALYWYWPMGYPVAMGLLAKLTAGDVFLAGRILHLFSFLLTAFSLKRIFQMEWSFYLFLIGTASFMGLFSSTLTEAGFVSFGFLGISEILNERPRLWFVITAFFIMFLIRYIGAFAGPFLILYYFFSKEKKWLLAGIILVILAVGYILLSWDLTHALPTAILSPVQVQSKTLLYQLLSAMFGYLSFFEFDHWGGSLGKVLFIIGLLPFGIIAYYWWKNGFLMRQQSSITVALMLFGLSYLLMLFFIVFGLGWDHDGWGIQSRYVAPGMLFVILAFFGGIDLTNEDRQKAKVMICVSSCLVLVYVGYFQSLIDYVKLYG